MLRTPSKSSESMIFLYNHKCTLYCSEWKPPGGRVISVTGCNSSQVICAAGSILFYVEVSFFPLNKFTL